MGKTAAKSRTYSYNLTIDDSLAFNIQANTTNISWYQETTGSDVSAYRYDLSQLIWSAETLKWASNNSLDPYTLGNSPVLVGQDPTVGIGNDTKANPGIMSSAFGITKDSTLYKALHNTYKNSKALSDALSAAGHAGWSITEQQSQAAWNINYDNFEASVDKLVKYTDPESGDIGSMPLSTERMALSDMDFNGGLLAKSPTMLRDLTNENRADAWFQIVFNSNNYTGSGGALPDPGVSIRRLEDGALFGLYSPGTDGTNNPPSNAEATSIYEMLSETTTNNHNITDRTFAFNYSAAYSNYLNRLSSGSSSFSNVNSNIDSQLQNEDLPSLELGDLEQNLNTAAKILKSEYLSNSVGSIYFLGASSLASSIDSLDIQVAKDSGGSELLASKRNGYLLGTGNYQSSMLIAQGGEDTLDARGSNQSNALIGGTGNDTIYDGSSSDYIDAGIGDDSIILSGGNDTVVLGDATDPTQLVGGSDTVNALGDNGAIQFFIAPSSYDTIYLGSSQNSTINTVAFDLSASNLSFNAKQVRTGAWYDEASGTLIQENTDGSYDIIGKTALTHPNTLVQPSARNDLSSSSNGILESLLDIFITPAAADEAAPDALSEGQIEQLYSQNVGSGEITPSSFNLTLYGFNGSSEDGITLDAAPTDQGPPDGLQVSEQNSLSPGVMSEIEFDDSSNASTLIGPIDTTSRVWSINGLGAASSIYGGSGNELLVADSRSIEQSGFVDTHGVYIQAGASGAQAIIGAQGDDTLIGGDGTLSPVTISFEDGDGPGGLSSLPGVTGFDWITGAGGNDMIEGGSNLDLIEGGSGADTIIGGSGEDVIFAGLSNYADGAGDWALSLLGDSNGVADDVWLTGIGGSFNDTATSHNANLIIAGTGDALIFGSLGDDTIYGGPGSDTIVGNNGNKTIYAGNGTSIIYADDNDALAAQDGVSWQDSGASYSDTIYGGSGTATIYGSGGDNYLYGGNGYTTIDVGNGNSYVSAGSGHATINGGNGNEVIDAGNGQSLVTLGSGNNYVYAGLGDNTIYAGTGDDTIEAGDGTATFIGSTGAVTYVIGTSTGSDTIELGTGATNIQLVGGLTEDNLVARYDGGDLELYDSDSDTQVIVSGYFVSGGTLALTFENGDVWNAQDIKNATFAPTNADNETLTGWDGSDSIIAGMGNTLIQGISGNNTLIGGAGDDTIQGGSGADIIESGSGTAQMNGGSGAETYVFNVGDGSSTITASSAGAGNDTLSFGAGVSLSDVGFARAGDSLLITINDSVDGSSPEILINNYFDSAAGSQHVVSQIKFADGTSLSQLDVTNQVSVFEGDGSDWQTVTSTVTGATYYAGDGNDVVVLGGPGDDLIVGGSGNDTLDGGSTGSNTIIAGSGDDLIEGGPLGDSISLGDGNATVASSGGNDTISWDGTGQQLLAGYGSTDDGEFGGVPKTGVDTIVMGNGLTPNELTFELTKPDPLDTTYEGYLPTLTIGVTGTDSSLTLRDAFALDDDGQSGIGNIEFSDGETLSFGQAIQRALENSERENGAYIFAPPNQTIDVTGANDTVDAAQGNDTIIATPGSTLIKAGGIDTIVFGRGSGQDMVVGGGNTDDINYAVHDLTVQLAQGVRPEDIEIAAVQSGNQPIYYSIRIKGTDDQLNIGVQGDDDSTDNSTPAQIILKFNDGTVWNASQLISHNSYNLVQFGADSGNDQLSFVTPAVVQMGAGITAAQLRFSTDGSGHLVMSMIGSSSTLTFTPNQVSTLNFADGSIVKMSDLITGMTVAQSSGNQFLTDISNSNELLVALGSGDTLQGGNGQDTLDPGTGNTVMIAGQSGSTTFLYDGAGDNTIQGNANALLQLGSSILAADISYGVQKDAVDGGVDLILTDTATGGELVLADYLGNSTASSYQPTMNIEFADGTMVGGFNPSTSVQTDTQGHTVLLAGSGDTVNAAGHDIIFAPNSGSVSIEGGTGSDTMVAGFNTTIDGGAGNDLLTGDGTLLFDKNSGHDTVASDGYTIRLGADIAPGDIGLRTSSTGSTEVYLLDTGASIFVAPLDSFTLVFSNGSQWNSQDLVSNVTGLGGTVGNDNDLIVGPNGATSFTFNAWNANSIVSGYDPGNFVVTFGQDLFGKSIAPNDVSLIENGADLLVTVKQPLEDGGQGTEAFTVKNYYRAQQNGDGSTSYTDAPLSFQFADGTVWNNATIQGLITQGGQTQSVSPDIWLTATQGNSLAAPDTNGVVGITEKNQGGNAIDLIGRSFNTSIALDPNANGADTLAVDGQTRAAITGFKDNDVVQLAADVRPADLMGEVVWTGSGWGLELSSAGNPSSSIIISDYFTTDDGGNIGDLGGTFEFADGTVLTGSNFLDLMEGFDTTSLEPPTAVSILNQSSLGGIEDSLVGGAGDDVLAAGVGNVTLTGAAGNDTLYTGDGSDTFVFGHGAGHDTILGSAASGAANVLAFSADVSSSDVSVARMDAAGTLVLTLNDTGETVTLPGYLQDAAHQSVQQVTFADGTVWSAATLANMAAQPSVANQYLAAAAGSESLLAGSGTDTLVADAGSDTLTAGSGSDTLYGGSGTDLLVGGSGQALMLGGNGHETYQFGAGFGSATVVASSAASNDVQFTSATATQVTATATNGSDLALTVQGGGTVTLSDALVWGANTSLTVHYADGSSQTLADILHQLPGYQKASAGDEALTGGTGADTLVADAGDDTLMGGAGNDTLVGGSGHSVLNAGSGDNLLVGGSGSTVFQFGADAGSDTIEATLPSSGTNVVQLTDNVAGITFTRPLLAPQGTSSASVESSGLEMVIQHQDGSLTTVNMQNHYTSGDVSEIEFQDGSILSIATVDAAIGESGTPLQIITGGNQTVNASPSGSILLGSGNDLVHLSSSNMIIMPATFAQDTMDASGGYQDTIAFSAGTSPNDISLAQQGDDLILSSDHGGSIDFQNWENFFPDDLPSLTFADGSNMTPDQSGMGIYDRGMVAAPDNGESITGGTGIDDLQSDQANDTLVGGTGDESFSIASGFGQDVVELNAGAQSNVITLGGNAIAENTVFARSGNDLLISVNGSSGADGQASTLTIAGYFQSGTASNALSNLSFSDNISLTGTQINQLLTQSNGAPTQYTGIVQTAGSGNVTLVSDNGIDTLVGGSGNDTLIGGTGRDLIETGTGNTDIQAGFGHDTIHFDAGFGHDTIENVDASAVVSFGSGIGASDLTFVEDGPSNIAVTVSGSNAPDGAASTIEIDGSDWGQGIMTDVTQFDFADGTVLTMAQALQEAQNGAAQIDAVTTTSQIASASNSTSTPTVQTDPASSSSRTETDQVTPSKADIGTKPYSLTTDGHAGANIRGGNGILASQGYRNGGGIDRSPSANQRGALAPPVSGLSTSANGENKAAPSMSSASAAMPGARPLDPWIDTGLHDPALGELIEDPYRRAGAPRDSFAENLGTPLMSYAPNDQAADATSRTGLGAAGSSYDRQVGHRGLARTTAVANDMAKALAAQGNVKSNASNDAQLPDAQVKLQDGTLWSVTGVDQVAAALAPSTSRGGVPSSHAAPAGGDLDHLRLIEAMASFGQTSAAQSTLSPEATADYAIVLAAQQH